MLPRGRHAAPREVVERSQRERLLAAMGAAVAEKGYAHTSVADVIARAGVSRKSFYELFVNKEQCFFETYDFAVDVLLTAIAEAMAGEEDPVAAAVAGSRAYLHGLSESPEFARTFLVEVLAAGPEALERRAAMFNRFADLLETVYARARVALPELPELPRHRFFATVGAVNELVYDHVRRHGPTSLDGLLEPVLDVQLSLLVGADTARRLRGTG